MSIEAALKKVGQALRAEIEEDGPRMAFEVTLAKRKTTMELRHLRYRVGIEVDESQRTVFFEEMLWERIDHPGIALDAAFRGQEEAYRVANVRERSLAAHRALFSQRYKLEFDFAGFRRQLGEACAKEGYQLRRLVPLEEQGDE